MPTYVNVAWTLVAIFKYGGVMIGLAGVGIFGFYFIGENARSARHGGNSIPATAWRGRGPVLGALLLAVGVLLQFASAIISPTMPATF